MNGLKRPLLIASVLLFVAGQMTAQEGNASLTENLKMHFDFENVSGTSVTDYISGVTAKTVGAAKVVEMGNYHVLDLGNGSGYLNMTKNAGELVRNLTDFTVSVCYRVDSRASLSGAGYFLWCFSQSAANTQTSSPYIAYRLNAQRMATSTGGYENETGMEVGAASVKGHWVHMLYRQEGQNGELWIDGKRVKQLSTMPTPKDAFTGTPAYCWIGRAPFSGDNYLKQTLVADFRLYDVAVSDNVVAGLAATGKELEKEYNYGVAGDFTTLMTTLEECKSFLTTATEGYAPNALAELCDKVYVAELELQAGRASQTLIDEYVSSLQSLLTSAKATMGFEAKRVFEVADDHGFIHPGGIVSQADIDRAKKMLADGDTRIKQAWDILCANEYSQSGVATWPTETVVRGGNSGQNYMNCARGAAMAYQNALRWKIGGTKENADAAVRIMMQWARQCKGLGGDTNISLAAGIYGHAFANAAELMRDYENWSREDFEEFKQWMIKVFFNPSIDFLRRRHDTWLNARYSNLGQRPGHYWSNWGLCNALCVMSIGILCDDVHMYNQGVSFYKYDHVGTYKDRSRQSVILNDGCDEFIGNLVPVVLPDERGPLGYLGQMQESGRDQGHSLMALGLALDICQVGFNQGDDLFAYMDDRIAAGTEFVAAMNFGGVDAATLPWKNYNYADCRGTMGAGWLMTGPNTGGVGEYRPYWDRAIGYYEGLRGVRLQYAEQASAKVCPDGGGGNYSQNSGGFDHLGFSTLTSWRPPITAEEAITPLSGNIIYNGKTLENQTNLGGLKYKYEVCPSKGIPADGSEITLQPRLPEGTTDTGLWLWDTGEQTREITVRADHSYIYRVTYTAENGKQSRQAFAIAVSGDAAPDVMTNEITVNGEIEQTTEKTVLEGTSVILYAGATTGWTNDYLWDNGVKGSVVVLPAITNSRSYTCQYANQSGAVSESRFTLTVVPAQQDIIIDGKTMEGSEATVFPGSDVVLQLSIPDYVQPEEVTWHDGSHGTTFRLNHITKGGIFTATYKEQLYSFRIDLKATEFSYYQLLSEEKGYVLVQTEEQLANLAGKCYFVLASDEADLLVGLADGKMNGNKALYYQTPTDPEADYTKLWRLEPFEGGYCLRNKAYDGLLIQTEMNAAWQMRTHDQPYDIFWAKYNITRSTSAWTIENGTYTGNWAGLWFPENGYADGEELACNKKDEQIGHFQIFALPYADMHQRLLSTDIEDEGKDATSVIINPTFNLFNHAGWTMTGTWGNQRFNGAVEVWHSTNFNFSQTLTGLPTGYYIVTCQMANGEGKNSGYLYATSDGKTTKAVVSQSCSGSSFDTQRNRMAADSGYGKLSVEAEVTDGKLTIGIKEPTSDTTWLVWDNFTLTYSLVATGIENLRFTLPDGRRPAPGSSGQCELQRSAEGVFDLTGRKVAPRVLGERSGNDACHPLSTSRLPKGLYIVNGKKYIINH